MHRYWKIYGFSWALIIIIFIAIVYRLALPKYDSFAEAKLVECKEVDSSYQGSPTFAYESTYQFITANRKMTFRNGSRFSCRPIGTTYRINYDKKNPDKYTFFDPDAFKHSDILFMGSIFLIITGGFSALMIYFTIKRSR